MRSAIKRCLMIVLVLAIMLFLATNTNSKKIDNNIMEIKAVVVETDDSNVIQSGISRIGDQMLIIEIREGELKGQKVDAINHLIGKLEIDSYYVNGDKIIAAILLDGDKIIGAKAVEKDRQNGVMLMFVVFVISLIIFAGIIGLKALLSFFASLVLIWYFLIPGLLSGGNPLLYVVIVILLLSAVIIFAVAGFSKKGVTAFLGTISGLFLMLGLTMCFGDILSLNGMTAPYAETLLFSGHLGLDMKKIFYAAVIIGASGAAMDIAMDVAASMEEIKLKKPDIGFRELVESGFNVGKAVIGTMTTTLLLAYSGGYLTLLMLFISKNSSFIRIINLKIVAAEIMRTIVGSIGLVLVAPLTAVIAGWIYCLHNDKQSDC